MYGFQQHYKAGDLPFEPSLCILEADVGLYTDNCFQRNKYTLYRTHKLLNTHIKEVRVAKKVVNKVI